MRATTLSHGSLQRARTYTAIHQNPVQGLEPLLSTRQSYHERRAQYNTTTMLITEFTLSGHNPHT